MAARRTTRSKALEFFNKGVDSDTAALEMMADRRYIAECYRDFQRSQRFKISNRSSESVNESLKPPKTFEKFILLLPDDPEKAAEVYAAYCKMVNNKNSDNLW